MLVAVPRPIVNGNMGFYGGKNRSPSLCSLDEGSQLESLLEEADKIGAAKNGLSKGVRTKKQVRFDMGRNEQFYYSYMVSSDDDSGKFDMEHHINYVNYEHSNGYDDSYDEDEDDDEDEEQYEEEEEEESEAEDSETKIPPGLLVNKSTVIQNGFSEHPDNSTDVVENGIEEQEERLEKFEGDHEDTCSAELAEEKVGEVKSQASHLESALFARQMSVKREISDLGEQLRKVREDTKQEMDRLQQELENRRTEYLTEMEEFHRNREEQKRKFEDELQEFRNEKKLVERRERYQEHEAIITQQEEELVQRKEQALEHEKEIVDYEEYLNRRHNVLNSKEEDLNILQNELDCLAQELESRKGRLEEKLRQHNDDDDPVATPPAYMRQRSASRASSLGRGLDLRVEELKTQNRQLLEELFTLRKACDSKDEELADLRSKLEGSENENKWLQQKVKHLDTHLGLARKTAELGTESLSPSVEEIMQRTSVDIRNARGLRPTLRSNRVSVPCGSSSISSHSRLPRQASDESLGTKASTSSGSGRSTKEANTRGSKSSRNGKDVGEGTGRHKLGREHTISSLCTVM